MKNIFILITLLFIALPFSACELGEDTGVGDSYNFKVISTNGPFSVYYGVDGEKYKFFNSYKIDDTIYHSFEMNLSSPSSVLISATGEESTTSISIYIYAESKLVKDITATRITDTNGNSQIITTKLSYSF